jgi:hypothetical protein
LITHAHSDHIEGLPRLKEASGAEVICSAVERPYLEGKIPIPRPPREKMSGLAYWMFGKPALWRGVPADRELNGGEILPEVMGGLHVLATPGHAPGHLTFWQPEPLPARWGQPSLLISSGDSAQRYPDLMKPPIIHKRNYPIGQSIVVQGDFYSAPIHSTLILDLDPVLRLSMVEDDFVTRPGLRNTWVDGEGIPFPAQAQDNFQPQAIHPAG